MATAMSAPSEPTNPINQAKERVTALMSGFTAGQRRTIVIALIAIVGLVLGVSYVQSHGPTATLYSGLTPDDVGVVTTKLQEKGVQYSLTNGGGSIEVPADQVYQLRADLSAVALPGSGKVGYGILDNQSITASDFSQQVGFQRAMEGEMAKTIEAMDGIEAATVHLAIPKDQTFALDSEKPSASVMIKTSGTIASEQVRAIQNIVASGIEGLDTTKVSVADSRGHLLASPGTGVSGAGDSDEATNKYEQSVQSAIEDLLAASVGPGKAKVAVSANLNFDQKSTTKESFEPPTTIAGIEGGLAKNASTKTENYGDGATGPSGLLGPNGTPADATTSTGGYTLDQKDVDYALNHVTETTNQAPGTVTGLSVAVMIDDKAIAADQIQGLQDLVSSAAGVKPDRGDSVVISRMKFDTTVQDQMKKELAAKTAAASDNTSMMIFGIAGGLALLILLSAFMVMRRRKKDLKRLEELASQLSRSDYESDRDSDGAVVLTPGNDGASADGRFGTATPPAMAVNGIENRREERQQVLTELIDNQPDEVAQLLRGWLGDRRAVKR